jgi:hypothetical protein
MAKVKGSRASAVSTKVSFGKRKTGILAKSVNKHARKTSKYRGQGR